MKPSEALAIHRAALRQVVSRHGLLRPRVFGSVLRGADTDGGDLDLVHGYFDINRDVVWDTAQQDLPHSRSRSRPCYSIYALRKREIRNKTTG